MTKFDPSAFRFVRLGDFAFPGRVSVYEYANHTLVDGKPTFLRINAYLSKDSNFITIWRGLLEPLFAESHLSARAASRPSTTAAAWRPRSSRSCAPRSPPTRRC
jgi:hypothetical protein